MIDDAKLTAGIDLLGRSGAKNVRIAYTPEEDGTPVVWYAVGEWPGGAEADAALGPVDAVMRLCERIIDGGECAHCRKVTVFEVEPVENPLLIALSCCVYAWDPELATFRRGCEGDA